MLLTKAMADYKLALDIWKSKIDAPTLYGHDTEVEALQQRCWARSEKWINLAASLLEVESVEKSLETLTELSKNTKKFLTLRGRNFGANEILGRQVSSGRIKLFLR